MNAGAYGGEMKDIVKSVDYIDENGNIKQISSNDLDFGYRTSYFKDKNLVILGATVCLEKGERNEIKEKIDDLQAKRKQKQPLNFPSAGSTFKRPVGNFAGTLIEKAGLKGKKIGGAMVSTKHAGFVINEDNASSKDVKELIKYIQKEIKNKNDINLECEVKFLEEL